MGQLSLAWKAIHIGLPMLVTVGNALGKEDQADNSLEGFTSTFTIISITASPFRLVFVTFLTGYN